MRWQRFNAFHLVVLIAPIRKIIDDDRRGSSTVFSRGYSTSQASTE